MLRQFFTGCLVIAACVVLFAATPSFATSPLPNTDITIQDGGGLVDKVDPVTCRLPSPGSLYELQGDASRCGTARATQFSTAACPGNSTSNLIVGNFSDDPTFTECVQVDNNSDKTYFIPLRTYREWNAFKAAAQSNPNLNLTLRACSCLPDSDDKAACGTANLVPASVAPTADLCSAGQPSDAFVAGSNWLWSCTHTNGSIAKCSAPVATANIRAGCYVDTLAWDWVTPDFCDGTEQNPDRNHYGTNVTGTNSITWSVGDTTNQGNDAYNFSDPNRYSVMWRGDCTGNSPWCGLGGVPNGRYTASVEVFDQLTRSVVYSATVVAEKRVISCQPLHYPDINGNCCKIGMPCKEVD